jgi:TRAP-type C4-dicarboxylate transport system permease small subunit
LSNFPLRKTDVALQRVEWLLKQISKVCGAAAVATLLGIAGVVLFQIFARYALPKSPVWTEELSRYLFAYTIVLASASVLIRERHVRLELFHHALSERKQGVCGLIIHGLLGVFAMVLLPYAWEFTANGHRQTSPALGIKLTGVFASTVVFFAVVAIVSLLLATRDFIRLVGGVKA